MKPFITELNGKIVKQIWLADKLGKSYNIYYKNNIYITDSIH